MAVDIQVAACKDDLCATLMGVDISVPARIAGRKTPHAETYTISHLLSTLAEGDFLSYPLSVTHRDRPDFLIEGVASKIGVEVTEAISQQYAAYCALAEREFPDIFLEPAHFRWGAPILTVEDMRDLLRQSQLTSNGRIGSCPEQEWALYIQSAVDTKLMKLARPDFGKFDHNWLSIYDNLPLPNLHIGNAITILKPLLHDRWSIVPTFDTLFIEHGPVIAKITACGSALLILNDLWE